MTESNEQKITVSNPDIDIAELISKDYIIICDTNVYLGLYRISPDYANFALECLKEVQEKLYVTQTIEVEYLRNYRPLFQHRQKVIEHSKEEILKSIKDQKSKLQSLCNVLINQQFTEVGKLQNTISDKYNELNQIIEGTFDEQSGLALLQDSWREDKVEIFFQELISNNRVIKNLDMIEIYDICAVGEKRYKKEIPPGYGDKKNKDGIRKYSDLIMWKEVIKYAKDCQKNIIFVSDDLKKDWWNLEENIYEFLPELVKEFEKDTQMRTSENNGIKGPSMKIVPFVSTDFYEAVSNSMGIEKSDVIDQVLNMTDGDYINNIKYEVEERIREILSSSEFEYMDQSVLTFSGSEEIEEWTIESCELISYEMTGRYDDQVDYELIYELQMGTLSYDYWGRDEETKEVLLSPAYEHGVKGELGIQITRTVDIFTDYTNSSEFNSLEITSSDFSETHFADPYEEDVEYTSDDYNYCPDCSSPISIENDGGNGFCSHCAPNH